MCIEVLGLLAALTEADSIATGETAWSAWREQLLRELVARVDAFLAGEEAPVTATMRDEEHDDLVARADGGVLVEEQVNGRLVVVAPDRPGLLSRIVGLLTLHGQSVRSAQVRSSKTGAAVDEFEIEPVFDKTPDWARFGTELREVLDGGRHLDAPIASRARTYERRATAARPAEPRVLVHEGASEDATVVEVRAADAVGLLYRITGVISGLDLDIRYAKVATLGHEAVDTFYLRHREGRKLTGDEAERVRVAVLAECGFPNGVAASSESVHK
jgi:[protein-PII] uridylyltransferase